MFPSPQRKWTTIIIKTSHYAAIPLLTTGTSISEISSHGSSCKTQWVFFISIKVVQLLPESHVILKTSGKLLMSWIQSSAPLLKHSVQAEVGAKQLLNWTAAPPLPVWPGLSGDFLTLHLLPRVFTTNDHLSSEYGDILPDITRRTSSPRVTTQTYMAPYDQK